MLTHRFVPDNRRFVPVSLFWIGLLGAAAFLLTNRTLTFSVVPVANWPVMASHILLSLLLSGYFLVSLLLYLYDHDWGTPANRRRIMIVAAALILLFVGLTMLRVYQNLQAAEWKLEPWEDVRLRYAHPARDQSLYQLRQDYAKQTRQTAEGDGPPKDILSLFLALGFFALCLVCNMIYRPYRVKVAREKGYNADSVFNLISGVAMLLLAVASVARPACLWILAGLALILFVCRVSKLGWLHALFFTLLQPLALTDAGFSKMKYNTLLFPRRNIHPTDVSAYTVGMNMVRKEELDRDIREDRELQEALRQSKKQ